MKTFLNERRRSAGYARRQDETSSYLRTHRMLSTDDENVKKQIWYIQ